MNILIAPNAFKNALTAERAALAIQTGLAKSKLNCNCTCFPVGDGGDGTGELIVHRFEGTTVKSAVHDPLGKKITAVYGLIEYGKTAIVEMASASGIRLLKNNQLDPLHANSRGTGEQILDAIEKGVSKIILAMGGSATVDGGSGILSALGVRFLNDKGDELDIMPGDLDKLDAIDLSGVDKSIGNTEVIVLCDVDNKLLGEHGASSVFGPQKGASPKDVIQLEKGLTKLSTVAKRYFAKDMAAVKYGGTAGGAAAGLFAFIDAHLVNGIEYFLQLTNFETSLEKSDLVITGEGSIDEQTLQGKGPFGVARLAKEKKIPVIGLAGKIPDSPGKALSQYFDRIISINPPGIKLGDAIAATEVNLIHTALKLGDELASENADRPDH